MKRIILTAVTSGMLAIASLATVANGPAIAGPADVHKTISVIGTGFNHASARANYNRKFASLNKAARRTGGGCNAFTGSYNTKFGRVSYKALVRCTYIQ